jgi:hypothetical protein
VRFLPLGLLLLAATNACAQDCRLDWPVIRGLFVRD